MQSVRHVKVGQHTQQVLQSYLAHQFDEPKHFKAATSGQLARHHSIQCRIHTVTAAAQDLIEKCQRSDELRFERLVGSVREAASTARHCQGHQAQKQNCVQKFESPL